MELLEETIQTKVVALYEAVTGTSLDFDIEEPNLDDASSLIEKVAAFNALKTAGFKPEDVIGLLNLDVMEWEEPPPPPEPVIPSARTEDQSHGSGAAVTIPVAKPAPPTKAARAVEERDAVTDPATTRAHARLQRFFAEQKHRVTNKMRTTLPAAKADRMKAEPSWWDPEEEDRELTATMREIYADVGRGGLQAVADTLGRIIFKGATNAVIADLLSVGGERIKDINARTLQA